ncbi:MAG TPA: glycoside hydrolase family 3 C-terminal domain-containing protein, partial [Phycisphaerae bacterium]|nr:glycoside hydrolase family 3 C-terminal domain-containing protein [Phycisphaerae bacterium]
PTLNLARDPRWGRVEESYGEDPYLTGRMGIAMCQGMQGDDPKYLKTIAVPKHFAVHSGEITRFYKSNDCPEPLIRDYYFPAFRDAFAEGGAMGTMIAFSGINGIPDTANKWLITDVLRNEWNYQGMVVSDNGGVPRLASAQHYVKTTREAVAAALNAGITIIADYENPNWTPDILQSIRDGSLKQETVDRAVLCNLLLRFRLGEFDPPSKVPFIKIPASAIGSKENTALALKTAQESFVLLKNDPAPRGYGFDKLLPLDLRKISSIALIGPRINSQPQFGAYSGVPANPSPTFRQALAAALGDRVILRTAISGDTEEAVAIAKSSDVVIFLGGINMEMEHENTDRPNLYLPIEQTNLLPKLAAANPLLIVVLEGGSAMDLQWVKARAPAAMMIWYSGEQGATALAQTLTGESNPSGRLPLTFYRAAGDLPTFEDYDISHGRTYWYLPKEKPAAFPFGHGLSYTTFEYANLKSPAEAAPSDTIKLTLDVRNTGKQDGAEVVQLYVRENNATTKIPRPLKQLKAFQRTEIPAGKTTTVTLTLPISSLAFWSMEAKKYVVDRGEYELQIGASSDDIRQTTKLTIK